MLRGTYGIWPHFINTKLRLQAGHGGIPVISAGRTVRQEYFYEFQSNLDKKRKPCPNIIKARNMAQEVKLLTCKHKALSLISPEPMHKSWACAAASLESQTGEAGTGL